MSLRIAVTGLAATYPFGGVFWDYMQYPLGFRQLGHEVLYIEDTGKWFYDADQSTFVPQGEQNVRKFTQAVASLDEGRSTPWFVRDALGESYGLPWDQVVDFCDKTTSSSTSRRPA